MANVSKSLLDAISIIANKSADEVSSDKTIKAIVKKIVSTSEGKYLVSYNSGDFYAYLQSGVTDLYNIGEKIYVLVPEGDMTQKKFILGRAQEEDQESKKILQSSLLNDYVAIGSNAVVENKYVSPNKAYVKKMQPLALNSHHINDYYYCYLHDPDSVKGLPRKNNKYIYDTLEYPSVSIDEETFSNSAQEAEALLIRAKFKASLDTELAGNYGIIINIAFADETNPQTDKDGNVTYSPKLISYTLDTSKMTGNPMKFYDYTSQYIVADFNGANYLYIDSIVAFSEGFVNTSINKHNDDDDIYVYIDDIEIVALNEITAVNGDYKLRLTTPKGNTIKVGKKNELKVAAVTTYINKDITKNTVFHWGIKDPSVTSLSDNYNAKLGAGYRKIDSSESELTLTVSDLTAAENTVICIAVYESDIILKAPVVLYNNNNKIDITIESDQGISFQFNEGDPILTCLINGKKNNYQESYPDEAFSFVWSKEDPELGTVVLNETETQLEEAKKQELEECKNASDGLSSQGRTTIQVLSYYATKISQVKNVTYLNGTRGPNIQCRLKNVNSFVTYSCSVYRGGIYIGYGSITLQNATSAVNDNYYITITNGSQVFQYNEAGVAPNSERLINPIEILNLTAIFHNPQGLEVTPKQVRWIVPDDNTLIDIPSLGLETDSRTGEKYYSGDTYPLSIKDTYDNTCQNNQVIAVVTHSDGTEYRQASDLLFTKIGDIGTNGTSTVVKINELINLPKEERLTIVKPFRGEATYNGLIPCKDNVALDAVLYTNNTRVTGYKNKWSIAGMPESTKSHCYNVETSDDNCLITYSLDTQRWLDTRIVKVQTTLEGKYFYNFYGIPAIEYYNGYNYQQYPIKVMRDGTLNTVLYDSNGTNPVYDESRGVHVELDGWEETGYLEWTVESGLKYDDGLYHNPNILLSKSAKSKTGSEELKTSYDIEDIQSNIFSAQDLGKICSKQAPAAISAYIDKFLVDVDNIIVDNILSSKKKITALWNRLSTFIKNSPDKQSIYVNTVYEEYKKIVGIMESEYEECQQVNKASAEIHEQIQAIWNSEWPNVITKERAQLKSSTIKTITELKDAYQKAYDNRATNAKMPLRTETFKPEFLTLLEDSTTGIDKYYSNYISSLGGAIEWTHPTLVEYCKVLMAYLRLLINETETCLQAEYYYTNDSGNNVNLISNIKSLYNIAFSDWSSINNSGNKQTIGQSIYDIIKESNEIAANIYDNVRSLYSYYQALFLNVKKYQISADSKTLNAWQAIINGQKPNLLNQIYVVPNNTFNGMYMNNNVVGTAFVKNNGIKQNIAKIYIPIIMTLNTYELASVNGWDGTAVDISDGYIMTPQIGAGIKDDTTNTFTGMVMGIIGNGNATKANTLAEKTKAADKTGLVGYYNGVQSVFIDSKTGSAYFGLPENDTDTTSGLNEGRIELIPGGVSKIGNWKIGNRFLYNVIDGNYEVRQDTDARNRNNANKKMVPHDRHGIMLSADQPYIHIKGEVYEEGNLSGINYSDEYNDINPGDSLELRLDTGNKSLFSIIQHTIGFGDEEDETLHFGYTVESPSNSIIKVKDYIPSKKSSGEVYGTTEYYIYSLLTNPSTGEYVNYYRKTNQSEQDEGFIINKTTGWSTNSITLHNENVYLKDALAESKFKKTTTNPVFSINNKTGVITYNPNNLEWTNGVKGVSNGAGWSSSSSEISSAKTFTVNFEYNKLISTPINKTYNIGALTNNTGYDVYEIAFDYTMSYDFTKMTLNNNSNNYIQFYIVNNNNNTISQALLKSEQIKIETGQDKNMSIKLVSENLNKLVKNSVYYLKMNVVIQNYIVNSDYSYTITPNTSSYKTPTPPQYGSVAITSLTAGSYNFTTVDGNSTISGTYEIYSSNRIRFKVNSAGVYDFILWRKGDTAIKSGGRTISGDYAKFFTSESKELKDLNDYYILNPAPTADNPWYISFYPKQSNTTETITYTQQTTGGNITTDEETTTETSEVTTITTIKYKLDDIPMKNTEYVYSIGWGSSDEYNSRAVSWKAMLTDLQFKTIIGFIPDDITALCIEDANGVKIKGTPYTKTHINAQDEQIVTFYSNYYQWIYEKHGNNADKQGQYGYIVVAQENGTLYKYIKTLTAASVNNWFRSTTLPVGIDGADIRFGIRDWISANIGSDAFKDASYWKEVIRVGLDENGRLFSSGLQDQKTYSRTGRLNSFGGAIRFYGQEIRVQKDKKSTTDYIPILKIFADSSQTKGTTYITQGSKDSGNISIRTASSGYIELGVSQTPNVNPTGTTTAQLAPTTTSHIKMQHGQGIHLQSNNIENNIINTIDLNTQGLSINSNKVAISSGVDNLKITHQLGSGYIWTKTPKYVISSYPAQTPSAAFNSGTYTSDNINCYKFSMEEETEKNKASIKLQVGKNSAALHIQNDEVILKNKGNRISIKSTEAENAISLLVNSMQINLQEEKIEMKNGNTAVRITKEEDSTYYSYVNITSNRGGALTINDRVSVQGYNGFVVENGISVFKKNLGTESSAYVNNTLHVGQSIVDSSVKEGVIRLYKKSENNKDQKYVAIKATHLEELYDWYMNKRWAIGWHGNTVWIRNVNGASNPEGEFKNNKYYWNYSRGLYGYKN